MLQIKPIEEKSEQERICALCGVEYNPDLLAYAAYSDGELSAICQFTMRGSVGYIYSLSPISGSYDADALYVAGRSALNFIDLCGVHFAVYYGSDEALATRIGFSKNETEPQYTMDLTGVFEGGCNCCSKK